MKENKKSEPKPKPEPCQNGSVPDPEDPLHFGPLRSGSNIISLGSGSGSASGSSSLLSTSIRSIIILHIKLVSKDIQTFR
jgi:hypothetical protein